MSSFRIALRLAPTALALPSLALAYGEAPEDRPSREERALHFFTDQLRVDPGAWDPQFDRTPLRPLVHEPSLNDAARFYADDMEENGCWNSDHSSCDGTPFGDRVRQFYAGGPIGENIARGQGDAWAAVYDAWLYSDGHRENMLSPAFSVLGTGFAPGGGLPIWVQDFGGAPEVEPITTSGTHWPLRPGAGADVEFHLALHDEGGSPASVRVDLGGVCRSLERDLGGDGSETWTTTRPLPEGECVPYVFTVERADGSVVEYPSTGSLLVPVGTSACAEWTEERVGSECVEGNLPEDDGPGFFGSAGGCGGGDETDPNGNVTDRVEYAACGLAFPGRAPLSLLALLPVLALRRRRA